MLFPQMFKGNQKMSKECCQMVHKSGCKTLIEGGGLRKWTCVATEPELSHIRNQDHFDSRNQLRCGPIQSTMHTFV